MGFWHACDQKKPPGYLQNFLDKMNSTIVLSAPILAYIAIDQKFLVDRAIFCTGTLIENRRFYTEN